MEAVAIGLIGLILGLAHGRDEAVLQLKVMQTDLTGIPLDYKFPVRRCGAAVAGDSGRRVGLRHPAGGDRRAQSLVEALEYE